MAILFIPGRAPEIVDVPINSDVRYLDGLLERDSSWYDHNLNLRDEFDFVHLGDSRTRHDQIWNTRPHDIVFIYHRYGNYIPYLVQQGTNGFAGGIQAAASGFHTPVYGKALLTTTGELDGRYFDGKYHTNIFGSQLVSID